MDSGELRRRNTGKTVDSGIEEPEKVSYDKEGEDAYKEGLKLYSQAEQSNFQDRSALTKSIRQVVKASERGVEEASIWMKGFLDSASALPPLPENLVRTMRSMTEATSTEKQVSLAARSMFQKMAGGHEAISRKEISQKAKTLLESEDAAPLKKSSRMLEGSINRLCNDALAINHTDEVTEEAFAEAAMTYARGEIGSPQGEMSGLTAEQMDEFTNANIIKKATEHPKQTVYYIKNVMLKTIERRGVRWIWSYIPTKQFYWLVVIYLVPMLTLNFIVSSVFSAIALGAFIAMIIATLQVATNSMGAIVQQEFISIFQYFSTDSSNKIDPTISRSKLMNRSMTAYLTFFIAIVVHILSIGLAHQIPYMHEILLMLSGLFAIAVFVQFEIYSSPLLMASLAGRLISWFYAFILMISPFVSIPSFLFVITKDIVSIPFFGGFTFSINLMSYVQLPLHISIIFYLLYTKSWYNIFSGLGPYVIFICWFVLCRYFFMASSADRLISAGVALVALIGLIPFFPIVFLAAPCFFLYLYGFSSLEFITSLSCVVLGSFLVVVVATKFKSIKEAKWLNIPLEYIFPLLIIFTIPLIILGGHLYARRFDPGALETVTVEQYTDYCGPDNWNNGNMVQTQLNCLHLQDRTFESQGTVRSVKISKIVNTRVEGLATFPNSLKTTFTCLFGENKPMCGNRRNMTTCVKSKCHFQHSYHFVYEIKVDMPLSNGLKNISVALTASNKFKTTVLNVTAGMNIRFNATFVSGMGSSELQLEAVSLLLPNGSGGGPEKVSDEEEWSEAVGVLWRVLRSLKNALFFLLEVLVGYTPTKLRKP